MIKLNTTRDVIKHFLPHIQGKVLDLGAGTAKYKQMIVEQNNQIAEYRACDAVKNNSAKTTSAMRLYLKNSFFILLLLYTT